MNKRQYKKWYKKFKRKHYTDVKRNRNLYKIFSEYRKAYANAFQVPESFLFSVVPTIDIRAKKANPLAKYDKLSKRYGNKSIIPGTVS